MGESVRSIEETAIRRKLQPLGLEIYEVKADGHCLYRSLEDQLAIRAREAPPSPLPPCLWSPVPHSRCMRRVRRITCVWCSLSVRFQQRCMKLSLFLQPASVQSCVCSPALWAGRSLTALSCWSPSSASPMLQRTMGCFRARITWV